MRCWNQPGLRVEPTVRHDGDEVVGRLRVEDRHGEGDVVVLLAEALPEEELIVEEDELAVDVLGHDPERLGRAVDLVVPLKVGRDRELDPQERPRDRDDGRRQLDCGFESADKGSDDVRFGN